MVTTSRIFHLDCHHTRILDTTTELYSEIYCISCARIRIVVKCIGEYRIKCNDCTYGRKFGGSGMLAFTAARRHAGARIGHVVLVYRGARLEHRIVSPVVAKSRENSRQLSLDDVPPY